MSEIDDEELDDIYRRAKARSVEMHEMLNYQNSARVEVLALSILLVCAVISVDRDADNVVNPWRLPIDDIASEALDLIVMRVAEEAAKIAGNN